MYFYLIGTDHRRLPVDARDEIYRGRKAISDFWVATDPHGSAILVTCNRLEIYGVTAYPDDAFGHIRRFARRFPDFAKYTYLRYGKAEVFRHALRLASGLESQLQGEKEILTQLASWKNALAAQPLKEIWSRALYLSAKIRAASGLDRDNGNVAALVFGDIREKLAAKESYEAVVVGTGKVAELFAKHRPPEARLRFAAHKHYKKAGELARRAGGAALAFEDLSDAIAGADVLICATSSPHYVIKKSHLGAWQAKAGHPLYIYDLAIPRDVEPEIAAVDGVFLQNLDDLGHIFSRHNGSRRESVELASELIEDVLRIGGEVTNDKYL